jgi:hypothetical protein
VRKTFGINRNDVKKLKKFKMINYTILDVIRTNKSGKMG